MAKCCGVLPCNCRVTAGPGVTVTGNGSAANPYTISADAADPTALAVTDSTTVDLGLTGSGAAGDPYTVTADVIVDPTPPAGGSNLLQNGPDGLYVECVDVRQCFSAGEGATYDPATGEFDARLSTDAGNAVVFGSDGGLYAPTGGGGGNVVTAGDTTTANNTVTGTGTAGDPYVVSTDVIVNPSPPAGGTNLLNTGPDGLYVECADVRQCFSAGDGAAYDPATGKISARLSADAGNTTVFGTDGGLYTPAASTALQAVDTPTIDMTVTGTGAAGDPYQVAADVIVAPEPNGLEETPTGLLVAPSGDAGNQLVIGGDGRLFVPPDPPLEIGCGLQGAGTVASPLAAFPIAGSDAWADHWACTDTQESTLKCDPNTGALWTPPEHFTAADHVYIEHMNPVVSNIGATGGWAIVQPGGTPGSVNFDVPANFLGSNCRLWSYTSHVHASIDVSASSTATFELGYVYQEDGGALQIRPIEGILTAFGSARRERYAGSLAETGFNRLASGTLALHYFIAVRVLTGTITINSWTSDATIHTTTQA